MASRVFVARELFSLREVGVLAALLNPGLHACYSQSTLCYLPITLDSVRTVNLFAWNTMLSGEI